MPEKPILLTSDVHLGVVPPETERAFVRWLEWAATEASTIVLNGDVFDFWFEYGAAIPRGHTRVLGALAAVVDSGTPITMMGGNHDWWGGSYLEDEIGVEFLRDPVERDYLGHRTLLAHGDGLGRGDWGYRMLKLILRGRFTVWGFRSLHPDFGAWLARRVTKTHGRLDGIPEHEKGHSDRLLEWGRAQLEERADLDLVVLGHTHTPVIEEVRPGGWYVNAGDWLVHQSYLRIERGADPVLTAWED